jgi:chorismate synthase
MAGSTFGKLFTVTTFGESHGKGIGAIVDGVPSGLILNEEIIQPYLDRRRPGQSKFTTKRNESDKVVIYSGVFDGKTTGTPIMLFVENEDQHSKDYSNIKDTYRPGHADYTFDSKYGIGNRDYRGGGRSSGRETLARVAAGAIASEILKQLGVTVTAFTKSIGSVSVTKNAYKFEEILENPIYMPNNKLAETATELIEDCMANQDSIGGIIECHVSGFPAGIGETVFDKLDAELAKAILSIGAVKGFEVGDGFSVATNVGSDNNDEFIHANSTIKKATNHSGGILGGMSDGADIIFRAAIKPTPSISTTQKTVDTAGNETSIVIHGRHDPVIVPRAVVVVESMTAITLVDLLFRNMPAKLDNLTNFYC